MTDNTEVAFDKEQYDRLRVLVDEVATSTQDALWDSQGYSIGSGLRGQPVEATWNIASQVGNSTNKLATEVRTYTDTLCAKALPEYADAVGKAAKHLEETDDNATGDAGGTGG